MSHKGTYLMLSCALFNPLKPGYNQSIFLQFPVFIVSLYQIYDCQWLMQDIVLKFYLY